MKYSQKTMVVPFELKTVDETTRTFEGFLSTSDLDLGNGYAKDIVLPKGFKRTMIDFKRSKAPYVPLMDSHGDRYNPSIRDGLGLMLDGKEELTGKQLELTLEGGKLFKWPEMRFWTKWSVITGNDGDEAMNRLRAGVVRKMSMGYAAIAFEFKTLLDGMRLRLLKEVRLDEGSLVMFPMNPAADVLLSTVKRLESVPRSELTQAQLFELAEAKGYIDALLSSSGSPEPLDGSAIADEKTGLAEGDPARIALDEQLRALQLASLAL